VTYERKKRVFGESEYSLRKMLVLAIDGITSFSFLPLRMIAMLGFVIFILSLVLSGWILWIKLFSGLFGPTDVPPWR
jgi:Ni,Fe-hydrogenase I cytochrome b subunit